MRKEQKRQHKLVRVSVMEDLWEATMACFSHVI